MEPRCERRLSQSRTAVASFEPRWAGERVSLLPLWLRSTLELRGEAGDLATAFGVPDAVGSG